MAGLPDVHTPPLTASVSVAVAPTHTLDAPVMLPADGVAVTFTVCIAVADPQLLVTV